uniref:Immunoglobulin superfamily member 3 n=1 Tax=Paramormyrops kingsleyae TaxID=1676925 RepID=A0A3B3RGR1_9TELE
MRGKTFVKWFLLVQEKSVFEITPGPLVRTEGSHATIWCNVTGYRGALVQDFEWSMYLPSAPEREIRVVSTAQEDYAYAAYATRVASGDVYVERLAPDSVMLHISRLQARDQGLFECYTPNTDGEFLGSYSARTNLTVILDTLSVTSHSQALSRVEGDSLQLNCEVSRQTLQHSHLSVGWYLRAEPSTPPLDLLTLSRDFVLRAGTPYKQRFASGDLRLDKMGSTAYRLTIHRLQPADQGLLYCEASEWIQDPDRSWYSMTRKQSEKTPLKVQPAGINCPFRVNVTDRRAYMTGEPLELRCAIDAQNILERYFSVSWVFSSSPVAMVGPNAVPLLAGDYVQRETTGQLTVRKESQAVYLLRLQNLRPEDAGKYICRVTEREREITSSVLNCINAKLSFKQMPYPTVSLSPGSNLTVSLISNSTDIEESGTIQLMCEIQSISGKVAGLSVTWRRLDRNGSTEQHIAALDQEGVVKLSPAYSDRAAYGGIRAERTDIDTFSLSIYNALPSDEGQYECEVTEWLPGPNNTWDSIGEKTAATYVMVQEPSFFVFASSRTPSVTYGDSFDLQCIVKPQHDPQMPTAVTWRFQPQLDGLPDAAFRDLMTFSHDGMIRWGDVAPGPGTRITVEHATSSSNFRLSVNRAGPREAGTYLCSAQLWRKNYNHSWSMVTERNSNLLGINVLKPGECDHYLLRKVQVYGTRGCAPTIGGSHSSASLVRSVQEFCRGGSAGLSNLGFRRNNVVFAPVMEQWTSSKLSAGFWRVHGSFVDLEKAFDRVLRGVLWGVLGEYGVPGFLLRAVRSLYDRCQSLVRRGGNKSDLFPVRVGLRQGCPLSPILFIVFMDRISRCSQGVEGVRFW